MKKNMRFKLWILLWITASWFSPFNSAFSVQSIPENDSPPLAEKRTWILKDVDIRTVISEVAKETGKDFVVSPQVNGKVTFISSHSLTSDELYQAFRALLEMSGYEAISVGPVVKIIPETYIKEDSSPILQNNMDNTSKGLAVAILRVKYVSASQIVKALRSLVFHFGYIEAYPLTNDIIICDRATNIQRLQTLIHKLDKSNATSTEVVSLKYAQATEIVTIVSSLLQQKGEGGNGISLAADSRSNLILIQGGTPEQHLQIRSLLAELDVNINQKSVNSDVIYLKYLRAEKAAVILNGFIQNYMHDRGKDTSGVAQAPTSSSLTDASNSLESSKSNSQNALVNYASSMAQSGGASNSPSGSTEQQAANNNQTNFTNMTPRMTRSGSVSPYVQWEESTNAVVLSAPAELMQKLKSVISKLDIRRPQVLIEAVIADVETYRASELGIELNTGGRVQVLTRFSSTLPVSGIGNDNNVGISNPLTLDAVGQGLSGTFYRGNNLRLLIRALEEDTRSNILSTPNLVTLDNEPAQIKVGQIISFSIGQIQNNPTGGNPLNFYNQQNVGLILTINPQITPDGSIKLTIEQELSTVLPGQVSAGGNPNLSERFIHTTVMANNGDILVLGGLIQNEWQNVTSKVPVLGDLPLIGVLFRSSEKELTKQNLMIFLRPTILYEDKDTVRVIGSKYENLRQAQLASEKNTTLHNSIVSPILPPFNKKAALPKPFIVYGKGDV